MKPLSFLVCVATLIFSATMNAQQLNSRSQSANENESKTSFLAKLSNRREMENSNQQSKIRLISNSPSLKLNNIISTSFAGTVTKKEEYAYDSKGNLTLCIGYNWKVSTSNWVGSYKLEYTHDNNGNLILRIYYQWDTSNSRWIGYEKKEFSYDSKGNETSYVSYDWDKPLSKWIGNRNEESIYDSNGKLILSNNIKWDTSTSNWAGYNAKSEYTYDNDGNLILEVVYYWNNTTSQWVLGRKYECTYNLNGNETIESVFIWDSATTQWIENGKGKIVYAYDSNGNLISEIDYDWDNNASKWVEWIKFEYSSDSKGNRTSYSYLSWEKTTSKWFGYWKADYSYDYNYNISNLCSGTSIFSEYMKNIPTEIKNYEWNKYSDNWDNEYIVDKYNYLPFNTTQIIKTENKDIKIYPNPAKDFVHIEGLTNPANIIVYNLHGKELINYFVSKDEIFSIKHLPKGLYLLRVKNNEFSFDKKLIKE